MLKRIRLTTITIFLLSGISAFTGESCTSPSKPKANPTLPKATHTYFDLLDSTQTGISFVNQVVDQPSFNILTYRNFYNGGGVAIGDINNDQLPDLYFTANQLSNKLYLNKGNFQFEDITDQAKVSGSKEWSTGAVMADVNGDGWMDIYVCNSGGVDGLDKENELFINQQDGTFTEEAAAYQLNNRGYSTQASFFDYDQDGDLDCYLLNNSFRDPGKIELFKSMRDKPDELGGDKLYRNDGEIFTDVTNDAGIYSSEIGFGLGAAIGDVNSDGLPDIYVSNDFWERDYLYLNQGDGSFSEELVERIDYCSISSMGGDIADINNDGHPEIFSTDMLAADNYRLKAMSAFDPFHLENTKYRANYHYQFAQNCLHLNNGSGFFQEAGMLAKVASTDWSWGALIFDFENDGLKDIFVSNGIAKDLMSMDFRDFLANNNIQAVSTNKGDNFFQTLIDKMPSNPLKNFAFSNKGNLRFDLHTEALGLAQPSFSNGAAFGDIDNDGDQDLIVNNVNMPSFIYRNEANERLENHYVKITFEGYDKNLFGIGAEVSISVNGQHQMMQNFNSRGFESSIEPQLIFGLGNATQIDELKVRWPDGKQQILTDIPADQTITLSHNKASSAPPSSESKQLNPIFSLAPASIIKGQTTHNENAYNDFDHEHLLLKMLSTEGPKIIEGDVNGDQLTDMILLGATDDEDKLFIQQADGTFSRKAVRGFQATSSFESTCGALFDQDGDGDLDLMLGAGGNEYQKGGQQFILRYFRNDGKGNFELDQSNIPQVVGNLSTIKANDVDKDGDMDLFLGARAIPGNYGLPPRNFLLANDQGRWVDITSPAVGGLGMVTDAEWADTDRDGDDDLIVVGDWMPVTILKNEAGQLANAEVIPGSEGWWNVLECADVDGDGDMDAVLGNWGLNSKFKASPAKPITMYVNDFDGNNKSEFIINWYPPLDQSAYPFATKPDLMTQLPELKKASLTYEEYAAKTYESLFSAEIRAQSIPYKVEYLESAILWNDQGLFTLSALPIQAQFSPVHAIVVDDLDEDGAADIWLGGNFYGLKPQLGRQNGSRGVFLKGDGVRTFTYLSTEASGINVTGEVRDACFIKRPGDQPNTLFVARNNAALLLFQRNSN